MSWIPELKQINLTRVFLRLLNNFLKLKTVIIIVAHRLQTVKSADRILLFEK
jgi:ABC-type multidrug transport system fused ATPase/permease subunit